MTRERRKMEKLDRKITHVLLNTGKYDENFWKTKWEDLVDRYGQAVEDYVHAEAKRRKNENCDY